MREFFVTFGMQYSRNPHKVLGEMPELPYGYWVIQAKDEENARAEAYRLFGHAWSFIYEPETFKHHHFPEGRLNRKIEAGDTVEYLHDKSAPKVVDRVKDDQLWLVYGNTIGGPVSANDYRAI